MYDAMTNGRAAERQPREWDTLLVRTWPLLRLLDFALYDDAGGHLLARPMKYMLFYNVLA